MIRGQCHDCIATKLRSASYPRGLSHASRLGLGTLIDHGAVVECPDHGHRVDSADPDAWNRAKEEAWRNPFAGATPETCIAEMDAIRHGLGDTCPDC